MATCTSPNALATSTPPSRRHSRLGLAWLAVFLALAGWTLLRSPSPPSTSTTAVAATPVTASIEPAPRIRARMKPIQDYRVGDRILVENPLGRVDEPEPDPATWKSVDLRQRKPSGKFVTMTLLLSPDAMDRLGIGRRREVAIDLPEMGVSGDAEVLSVRPCPEIERGEGSVITGVFAHESEGNLLNVFIEGTDEPLGVTATHPFFSDDRGEFVRADQLEPGERVADLTAAGASAIRAVAPRGGSEMVYNLQVNRQHVYNVGPLGTLVHNNCVDQAKELQAKIGGTIWKVQLSAAAARGNNLRKWVNLPGLSGGRPYVYHAYVVKTQNGVTMLFDNVFTKGIPLDEWMKEYARINGISLAQAKKELEWAIPNLIKDSENLH